MTGQLVFITDHARKDILYSVWVTHDRTACIQYGSHMIGQLVHRLTILTLTKRAWFRRLSPVLCLKTVARSVLHSDGRSLVCYSLEACVAFMMVLASSVAPSYASLCGLIVKTLQWEDVYCITCVKSHALLLC